MKKLVLFALLLSIYTSCRKEGITVIAANLVNATPHHIMILPYKNGIVEKKDTIRIPPNTHFEFGYGSIRGLITIPLFSSEYFGGSDDSIVVIFDDLYSITHYVNIPTDTAPNYYLYTSLRNLGNRLSYTFYTEKKSKHRRRNNHVYNFTEQDYLDAK
jgi:hypothetical protein